MDASQVLAAANKQLQSELACVRAEYANATLGEIARLMKRTNTNHATDALHAEAMQRVRRNAWAKVTCAA